MKTKLKTSPLLLTLLALLLALGACATVENQDEKASYGAQELFPEPPRPDGQSDVIELRCDPIDTVHVAFIGVGSRGKGAVRRFTYLEGVKVVAICDVVQENLDKSQDILTERGLPEADLYSGEEDWKKVC